MPFGRGHGGEYVPSSLTLPISPTPRPVEKFFRQTGISTTASFAKVSFTYPKNVVKLYETGAAQSFEYSFDGTTVHGVVAPSGNVQFSNLFTNGVWIKNGSGVATVTAEALVGDL